MTRLRVLLSRLLDPVRRRWGAPLGGQILILARLSSPDVTVRL